MNKLAMDVKRKNLLTALVLAVIAAVVFIYTLSNLR
jgi:hypothetical protein